MIDDEERRITEYASPPCFMHELTPGYCLETQLIGRGSWSDVKRFRKTERERLLTARSIMTAGERAQKGLRIEARMASRINVSNTLVVGCYWPIRGEPDLREWMTQFVRAGGTITLPVVIQKDWPLEYRKWTPECGMERGFWNILVPSHGPALQPSIVLAPLVGFDEAGYRLGYGGGYFDRTLAAMKNRPRAIGVGYAISRIPTIYPQPHDVKMDEVITEE